jgi:3-dehydroquinate dehydratase-2
MKKILVLHGPNLNLLGLREPEIYGNTTLEELNNQLIQQADYAGFSLSCLQTNSESALIDAVHQAEEDKVSFIIINAGAFSHTSIALRDAFKAVSIPFIEVHISNIYARESFRHQSWLSGIAKGVICGLGVKGYILALQAILEKNYH